VRILPWHVHAAWTSSFVRGRHTYLIPVLPDRGPDGLAERWLGGRRARVTGTDLLDRFVRDWDLLLDEVRR
jgi:hypothetical protein